MYTCDFFGIEELVDPQILIKYAGREAVLWSRFNPQYLQVLDKLRREFGPIVINGNFMGALYSESGVRMAGTTTGASLSMHKLWAAFDLKFHDHLPLDVQKKILANPAKYMPITRMENAEKTVTWLHIDFGNPPVPNKIHVFNP